MLKKEDYNVTAQDRLQYAQYELLQQLVDLLSGENEIVTPELQEKIEASNDNNEIIQELKKSPKPKVGGEVKNDKAGNSKKRKTTDK